ncbi:MAG TPA: hypothetical protein DIC46_02440 [Porphyromonadaceae bacterium]|mgnify:FL=1|jgi:ABC-type lipoprotein release transport system permease subunit|nr:hypothetical protein [Porphyromonadaceae bacterium]
MESFIKLAFRNVKRNRHSTVLNGVGIVLSVISLLFIFSLSRGIEEQIVSRNIHFETGAIMVDFDEKTSSFENLSGDSLLRSITTTLNKNKEVCGYSFRMYPKKATLYLNDDTPSINVIGIAESELPLLSEILKLLQGNADFGNMKKGILVSNGIAEEYNLKIGDECNIMLQSVDGQINLNDFIITGIFRYTSQLNKSSVYMHYETTKELYNAHLPSKIIVNIHHLERAEEVKDSLIQQLGRIPASTLELPREGFQITSYNDHVGMAKTLSGINRYGMLSIAVFLLSISFVGIWSMQVENIHNRSKEIGTFLSMGFTRASVKSIFLYESIIISLVYFGIALLLIITLITGINIQEGLYLGDNASFSFGSSIINPILSIKDVCIVFFIAISYPLLATIVSLNTLNHNNIVQLFKIN